jgi:FkbM family methyltransferase
MNVTDLLPPIVTRGLKAAKAKMRGPVRHIDAMGRRIEHRGSEADVGVVYQVFNCRDYDLTRLKRYPEIQRYYEQAKAPLIVDAGANIGASAVWFAQTYPRASVTAIEPHAGNFELLNKNTAGLSVKNLRGAIASKPGSIRLFDPGEGEWGFRTGGKGEGLGEVPAFTVDQLVRDDPFILKIDIEGGEADLFEGEAFAMFPVLIIELHDWLMPRGGTSKSFLAWHASQDRDFVHIGENVFSLCNRLLQPE